MQYVVFYIWLLSLSIVFSMIFEVMKWNNVLVLCFFLLLNDITLYLYTTFCSSIYQLLDVWIVSMFWLLWIMLLWTVTYKCLCGHMFSFPLSKYPGMHLQCHVVTLCLTFWGTAILFSKVAVPFYIPTISVWEFPFLHILTNTWYYLFCLFHWRIVDIQYYMLQVYNIVIHSLLKLYFFYSYYKILAIFLILYNISL